MRPEKAKRIEVNPPQGGLAGLNHALSGLEFAALPPGPDFVKGAIPEKRKKLGRVVLRKEKAHRGGKTVIVIDQFTATISDVEIEELAKDLRRSLGTGGAAKDRTIEVQGDQPAKVREFLERAGYDVAGI